MPTKINDNWIDVSDLTPEERLARWTKKFGNMEEEPEETVEEVTIDDELRNNALMAVKPSNSDVLSTKSKDLVNQIISEDDPSKLKDLTDLFEMNQRKKNIARMGRLSDILEMVDDEVITRLSTVPDSMSDKDLVGYMTAAQKSMDSIKQSMDATPLVQINNQKIEIHNDSGLNRESRKKVLDAVMAIIENAQASDDVIEIEGEEEEWEET